jgi:hypothetical protein
MVKEAMFKSTVKKLKLLSGKEVDLTLNFKRLLEVRSKRKDLYERYNNIIMQGTKDSFDVITVIYTAYLCGLNQIEDGMSEDEFMDELPPYIMTLNAIVRDLVTAKKPEASEKPSEAKEESQK